MRWPSPRKKHAADESLESLHRVNPHVMGALEAASLEVDPIGWTADRHR